ncbi:glycoside hydrolase family 18 protein [Vagococcus coleopterorum]|uniref:chitinase n=1 Tax=Vagococcus coleopterorum TaxID=2714946 RepID=A0A6G8AL95_9ENTE|nr:glycoside hydrolase family 18 protein [Vagococcus coleopterorum]QIL45750.1 glycoside hydrolase family 18 protein [Vagococcus coleopterorum]
MKRRQIVVLGAVLISLVFGMMSFSQKSEAAARKFKTVGYVPSYDIAQLETGVDLNQFTDINYFSMVPQTDGTIEFTDAGTDQMLKDLVAKAHKANVKVGVSIGGWNLSDNFEAATSDDTRKTFIENLVKLTDKYELDTIDIDWEYPQEDYAKQFETFMKELKKEMAAKDIKVTICVPTGISSNGTATDKWEKFFTPDALNQADWINIMSYDAEVEGSPNHSPEELLGQTLEYWNDIMGGDKMDHLIGGIPYYAKSEQKQVITYNKVVDIFQEKVEGDVINYRGEEFLFNNQDTVRAKTKDAIDLGSLGVMVWTPTQDADLKSKHRLTDAIIETIDDSSKVALDKTKVLIGKVKIEEKVKSHAQMIWNILALILAILSGLLFKGIFNNYLPTELRGKHVNKPKFAKLVGSIGFVLVFLILVFANLPWYLILLVFAAIFGGAYYLLKL